MRKKQQLGPRPDPTERKTNDFRPQTVYHLQARHQQPDGNENAVYGPPCPRVEGYPSGMFPYSRCALEVSITASGGDLKPLHGSRLPKLRKSTDNVKKLKAGACVASSTGYSRRQLHRGKQARSHDNLAGPRGYSPVKSEEPLAGRNETF